MSAVSPLPHAAAAAPPASGWVRGPLWDGLWLQSAAWLAPIVALLSWGWPEPWNSPVHTLYVALGALLWIGHRFSSAWMAWGSTAYRPLLRQQPLRFVVVPLLAVAAVFVVILDPTGLLPGTPLMRAATLGAVDYLFGSYHFAAQHFGVLSLYRSRAGRSRDTRLRRGDRLFAVGAGGGLVVVAELTRGLTGLPAHVLPEGLDVTAFIAYAAPAATLGLLLALGGALWLLAAELRSPSPSLPRALYIAGLAGSVAAAFVLDPFVFVVVWTVQHWLAAIGLASAVLTGEPEPSPSPRWRRLVHRVNRSPVRQVLVLVLVSLLLTPLFEVEAGATREDRPVLQALGPMADLWLTSEAVLPWLLALGLGTGVLHYLLDRAVWRFSDPAVRAAAAPLLRR